MGETTEMILDGTLCKMCGSYIDGETPRYPRYCEDCEQEDENEKNA